MQLESEWRIIMRNKTCQLGKGGGGRGMRGGGALSGRQEMNSLITEEKGRKLYRKTLSSIQTYWVKYRQKAHVWLPRG